MSNIKMQWYILNSRAVGAAHKIRREMLKYLDRDDFDAQESYILESNSEDKEETSIKADVSIKSTNDLNTKSYTNDKTLVTKNDDKIVATEKNNDEQVDEVEVIVHDKILNRWKQTSNFIEDIFVPVVYTEAIGKNKKKIAKNTIPGYIFIKMERNFHTEEFLKFISLRLKIIGKASQKEIDDIKKRLQDIDLSGKKDYAIGAGIKVVEGPFENFQGYIEAIDYESESVRVAVKVFDRSTPIQLSFQQIELIK